MSLGASIVQMIRAKLADGKLKWSEINGAVLESWVDEKFPNWQPPKAKVPRKPKETDEQWIAGLKVDPHNVGLDIEHQLREAQFWCRNQKPKRACSRAFFVNWLIRASQSKPILTDTKQRASAPVPQKPPGLDSWLKVNLPDCMYLQVAWEDWPSYARDSVLQQMSAEEQRNKFA